MLSYLASGCFILLASGATYGALAANQLLGLNGKTAGYAVTGLTTSVLVPVLNVIHYQVEDGKVVGCGRWLGLDRCWLYVYL